MWFVRFHWAAEARLPLGVLRSARLYRSEDGCEGCAYIEEQPENRVASLAQEAGVIKLELLGEVPGAASGRDARWHYIVATDVLAEREEDFNAWYDEEHLPGLASVPGTSHAARYRVIEGAGPRYHACYDLAERSALNSPGWLAVRATPWSSRVRPAFRNTRRALYERVEIAAAA